MNEDIGIKNPMEIAVDHQVRIGELLKEINSIGEEISLIYFDHVEIETQKFHRLPVMFTIDASGLEITFKISISDYEKLFVVGQYFLSVEKAICSLNELLLYRREYLNQLHKIRGNREELKMREEKDIEPIIISAEQQMKIIKLISQLNFLTNKLKGIALCSYNMNFIISEHGLMELSFSVLFDGEHFSFFGEKFFMAKQAISFLEGLVLVRKEMVELEEQGHVRII